MKRLLAVLVLAGAAGCGGDKDLPPTKDADAIKREQERLGGGPGAGPAGKPKGAK